MNEKNDFGMPWVVLGLINEKDWMIQFPDSAVEAPNGYFLNEFCAPRELRHSDWDRLG